jgi:hypothetical protein
MELAKAGASDDTALALVNLLERLAFGASDQRWDEETRERVLAVAGDVAAGDQWTEHWWQTELAPQVRSLRDLQTIAVRTRAVAKRLVAYYLVRS